MRRDGGRPCITHMGAGRSCAPELQETGTGTICTIVEIPQRTRPRPINRKHRTCTRFSLTEEKSLREIAGSKTAGVCASRCGKRGALDRKAAAGGDTPTTGDEFGLSPLPWLKLLAPTFSHGWRRGPHDGAAAAAGNDAGKPELALMGRWPGFCYYSPLGLKSGAKDANTARVKHKMSNTLRSWPWIECDSCRAELAVRQPAWSSRAGPEGELNQRRASDWITASAPVR